MKWGEVVHREIGWVGYTALRPVSDLVATLHWSREGVRVAKKRRKARVAKGKGKKKWYPFVPSKEERYLSVNTGPISFVYQITGHIENTDEGTVQIKAVPIEDAIRPVELKFQPPLERFGQDGTGFNYHWQQLTYMFEFANPADHPMLSSALDADERLLLSRYVQTCRHLAGYSLISSSGGVRLSGLGEHQETKIQVDLPSHEEFAGFSATFRQLHNDGEQASFGKAWQLVNKATNTAGLPDETRSTANAELQKWKRARNSLKEKPAPMLVAEKLKPNMKEDSPRPFQGVVPEMLIKTFNYGDTLHWGDQREKLAELTSGEESYANYHKHCCVTTMMSLSHLYFGFAELVAAAIGEEA